MIDTGDIGCVARWLVGALSARGYQRDDLVALTTALLDEVLASRDHESRSSGRRRER
jgi:hypothetical protein